MAITIHCLLYNNLGSLRLGRRVILVLGHDLAPDPDLNISIASRTVLQEFSQTADDDDYARLLNPHLVSG